MIHNSQAERSRRPVYPSISEWIPEWKDTGRASCQSEPVGFSKIYFVPKFFSTSNAFGKRILFSR